jgi:hypothetical protein
VLRQQRLRLLGLHLLLAKLAVLLMLTKLLVLKHLVAAGLP